MMERSFFGRNKGRVIPPERVLHRLREIGNLQYINRHAFTALNPNVFDGFCVGTQQTITEDAAKRLRLEINALRNKIKKVRTHTTLENLNFLYKEPRFKPFSAFKAEMGSSFVVRVRTFKNPSNSAIREEEVEAIKLLLLRIENELSF
jgi:hypothetical protein